MHGFLRHPLIIILRRAGSGMSQGVCDHTDIDIVIDHEAGECVAEILQRNIRKVRSISIDSPAESFEILGDSIRFERFVHIVGQDIFWPLYSLLDGPGDHLLASSVRFYPFNHEGHQLRPALPEDGLHVSHIAVCIHTLIKNEVGAMV